MTKSSTNLAFTTLYKTTKTGLKSRGTFCIIDNPKFLVPLGFWQRLTWNFNLDFKIMNLAKLSKKNVSPTVTAVHFKTSILNKISCLDMILFWFSDFLTPFHRSVLQRETRIARVILLSVTVVCWVSINSCGITRKRLELILLQRG